jgi:hypothetical protein
MSQGSLGQKRVKAEFNPSKSEPVDVLRNKSAELIDILESLRNYPSAGSGEKQRLISIAQTEIESACMFAVKACFTE